MRHDDLTEDALQAIKDAAASGVLLATSEKKDNYCRLWARDSVVAGLSVLWENEKPLASAFHKSLKLLCQASNRYGQIPSNLSGDATNEIASVSFGGTVGRSDASFWWIIGAVSFLRSNADAEFASVVEKQTEKIFTLSESWEFNGKHLMYLPMGGNWADEYITHGYVLFDQALRYWSFSLAGEFFERKEWLEKANEIKSAIKRHYLFELPLSESLYTVSQQSKLSQQSLKDSFIASFSPGDIVNHFDAWSVALLLLLDIPSDASKSILVAQIEKLLREYDNKGIPAFWPVVRQSDLSHSYLMNNFSFRFKNHPGHFHNGGIWPVVNGFLIAGLQACGQKSLAVRLREAMTRQLSKHHADMPFAEYFDLEEGKPGGMKKLCFSAAGYLLAHRALEDVGNLNRLLPQSVIDGLNVRKRFAQCASNLLDLLPLSGNLPIAVSIAGQSGSGKTTLSAYLTEALEQRGIKSAALYQDDFFRLPPRQNHLARVANFDHVGYGEVNKTLLEKTISDIKRADSRSIRVPKMNWAADRREEIEIDVCDVQVILVEGTYTSALNGIDYRLFIDSDYTQTAKNRVARNREKVDDFIEKVLKKESDLINAHKPLSDCVINNDLEIFKNDNPSRL